MGRVKQSAGILIYRRTGRGLEVLLIHPGGPFWKHKDEGAWSVPKGQIENDGEAPLEVARREFHEETGQTAPERLTPLPPVRQKGGKLVSVWCGEGDFDLSTFRSNTFRMEYPPGSNQFAEFPEADRAEFFTIAEARRKLLASQLPLLDELESMLGGK